MVNFIIIIFFSIIFKSIILFCYDLFFEIKVVLIIKSESGQSELAINSSTVILHAFKKCYGIERSTLNIYKIIFINNNGFIRKIL